MKLKHILFASFVFTILQTANAQWSKGKEKGYYKLSGWYLAADQHYTDSGDIDPNATRGIFNLSLYAEYGVTNKIDVIGYVPFFSRTFQNEQISGTNGTILQEGEALNNIGDSELGIRYGILKNKSLALSTTLKLGIPIGNDAGGSDGSFQTGDGEFNQLLQLDLGIPFSFGSTSLYAKTFFGFNNRTKGFSDELRFGGEAGIEFWDKKLWLIVRADRIHSLQNGNLSAQNSQGSIFANNIEFTSIGAELVYYISKKIGISFSYTSAVSGRIIYAAPSYSGGLFLDIK